VAAGGPAGEHNPPGIDRQLARVALQPVQRRPRVRQGVNGRGLVAGKDLVIRQGGDKPALGKRFRLGGERAHIADPPAAAKKEQDRRAGPGRAVG
jgi:hypothetical protein